MSKRVKIIGGIVGGMLLIGIVGLVVGGRLSGPSEDKLVPQPSDPTATATATSEYPPRVLSHLRALAQETESTLSGGMRKL